VRQYLGLIEALLRGLRALSPVGFQPGVEPDQTGNDDDSEDCPEEIHGRPPFQAGKLIGHRLSIPSARSLPGP
jgi:hypothetical protein